MTHLRDIPSKPNVAIRRHPVSHPNQKPLDFPKIQHAFHMPTHIVPRVGGQSVAHAVYGVKEPAFDQGVNEVYPTKGGDYV